MSEAKLTDILSNNSSRIGALETTDISDNLPIARIVKAFNTITVSPIYCSEDTVCSEDTIISEDVSGILDCFNTELQYIGLGTGVAPSIGDALLQNEQIRKQVSESFIDNDTLVKEIYLEENEGNGIAYTNTGIFYDGATANINTGKLLTGGAVDNITKDSTFILVVSHEITALEV